MKLWRFSFGWLSLVLACCGGDKRLLVGEERHESEEPRAGAGSGGAAGSGATSEAGSASAAGGAGAAGASGAAGSNFGGRTGGGRDRPNGQMDCMQMARDYDSALIGAQICMSMDPDPCTAMVPDDLFCGCPTYANPARYNDLMRIYNLLAASADCPGQECGDTACPSTDKGGFCLPGQDSPPRPHCVVAR